MDERDLVLNCNGTCFICLQQVSKDQNTHKEGQKVFSFSVIERFLSLNWQVIWNVRDLDFHPWLVRLKESSVKVFVPLCPPCGSLVDQFNRLHETLKETRVSMDLCLAKICEALDNSRFNLKESVAAKLRNKSFDVSYGKVGLQLMDNLRKEARGAAKVHLAKPRVPSPQKSSTSSHSPVVINFDVPVPTSVESKEYLSPPEEEIASCDGVTEDDVEIEAILEIKIEPNDHNLGQRSEITIIGTSSLAGHESLANSNEPETPSSAPPPTLRSKASSAVSNSSKNVASASSSGIPDHTRCHCGGLVPNKQMTAHVLTCHPEDLFKDLRKPSVKPVEFTQLIKKDLIKDRLKIEKGQCGFCVFKSANKRIYTRSKTVMEHLMKHHRKNLTKIVVELQDKHTNVSKKNVAAQRCRNDEDGGKPNERPKPAMMQSCQYCQLITSSESMDPHLRAYHCEHFFKHLKDPSITESRFLYLVQHRLINEMLPRKAFCPVCTIAIAKCHMQSHFILAHFDFLCKKFVEIQAEWIRTFGMLEAASAANTDEAEQDHSNFVFVKMEGNMDFVDEEECESEKA